MAAATVSIPPVIDLKTSASYPIRLGASITKPADSHRQYMSIRYNHRPQFHGAQEVQATVTQRKGNETKLRLRHGGDSYGYDGERARAGDSYVLVFKGGDGKRQEAVLEKVGSRYVYNLVSAPKTSSEELAKRYLHITLDDDQEVGATVDDDEAEEAVADPSNPYDYRHFLKAALAEKAKRPELVAPRSTAGIPLVQPRTATATPVSRPAKRDGSSALLQQKKKRKAPPAASKPADAKRAKPGQEALSLRAETTRAKTDAPPPHIRVERKASVLRRPSYDDDDDDDDGELVLENETQSEDKKLASRQTAMALALSGQLGHQGPISLRSAANSPASQIAASPMPLRPEGVDDEEDEDVEYDDVGGVESPPESDTYADMSSRRVEVGDDDDDADEEDEDADVEDLELPSPATEHRPSVSAATVTTAVGEEDDLDAQLAAAMAEEEEEESEEE
ncbi:hypothetical protein LTR85_011499 [Meristemomyces frigidus]|nr:hypothetical protein LTR85_011499 [Meristemomyces frigidus]